MMPLLVRRVGQQSQVTGPLDGLLDDTLMLGAGTRDASRQDLGTLYQVLLEEPEVLVVHDVELVGTHPTDLATPEEELLLA
jgi:hypothetical protein